MPANLAVQSLHVLHQKGISAHSQRFLAVEGRKILQSVSNFKFLSSRILTEFYFVDSNHTDHETSFKDEHTRTDFLSASQTQLNFMFPLMQFAVLFWFKKLMHREEPDQDLYDIGTIRWILTVQAILTMYLCYISFYSE